MSQESRAKIEELESALEGVEGLVDRFFEVPSLENFQAYGRPLVKFGGALKDAEKAALEGIKGVRDRYEVLKQRLENFAKIAAAMRIGEEE